jgi:hypothetical protein
MNDIKIVDKIIPTGYSDAIEQDLLRRDFPWCYIDDVTSVDYGSNSGLAHVAFDHGAKPSDWYPFIKPLVYSITEANGQPLKELYRIRVGFLPRFNDSNYTHNTPHVDFLWPHYTACYYVNDSDGDTILFEQTLDDVGINVSDPQPLREYTDKTKFVEVARATPRKGSVCIFDGKRFHASTKPQQHDRRLVITINFL